MSIWHLDRTALTIMTSSSSDSKLCYTRYQARKLATSSTSQMRLMMWTQKTQMMT